MFCCNSQWFDISWDVVGHLGKCHLGWGSLKCCLSIPITGKFPALQNSYQTENHYLCQSVYHNVSYTLLLCKGQVMECKFIPKPHITIIVYGGLVLYYQTNMLMGLLLTHNLSLRIWCHSQVDYCIWTIRFITLLDCHWEDHNHLVIYCSKTQTSMQCVHHVIESLHVKLA